MSDPIEEKADQLTIAAKAAEPKAAGAMVGADRLRRKLKQPPPEMVRSQAWVAVQKLTAEVNQVREDMRTISGRVDELAGWTARVDLLERQIVGSFDLHRRMKNLLEQAFGREDVRHLLSDALLALLVAPPPPRRKHGPSRGGHRL